MLFSCRPSTLLLCTLLAVPAIAARIDGVWQAKYQDNNGRSHEMVFKLASVKDKITGEVRIGTVDLPIQKGKFDGTNVSFEVRFVYDPGYPEDTILFDGKLAGEVLELTRTTQGKPGSQKLVARKTGAKL